MNRLVIMAVGLLLIEGLCWFFGIDKVANQIQVISAAPWFYLIYRVEELHRLHKKRDREKS